ncbi:M1 family metallopeptidase [Sphingomonas glaciei]|uniref:Aminopeptidase N n=1 Tax=Sphingomonas glaciei TaxID=2938948 RepID=A0ABY5MRF8_9SPHN|nr:M1 family metallopeptidase [Sphingomonas glaciei]UUR07074.1 M1 family metallopeptidase [Sphingomonas glaciei]
MTRIALLLASALTLSACQTVAGGTATAPATSPVLATADAADPHSFARPLEARVIHVDLDLAFDFAAKAVTGTATLDIDRQPTAREIVLDSDGYQVSAVTDAATGAPLAFAYGAEQAALGRPLTIQLGAGTRKIRIAYSARDAEALQWLTPEQTAGKRQPFLFSQGQAILNRSWIPTQDSPGIRQTWSAKVTVPVALTAVMSGLRSDEVTVGTGGTRTYRFHMDKPVAPYLIAIAVGDLKFQPLGSRTGVWAEPATLPAAARELEDTEKMVETAERLFGPYRWGRYDMIVLPPSFPFGGMENPTLTFLTPTFIAGDKSLVSLIAHELAHSWSGNLATNATWADFWLNEGTTTYATSRIVEAVYGKRVADQQIALGIDSLDGELKNLPTADTRLAIDLRGRSPDDGLTDIAYEKGAAFLRMIEANVGRERFDPFLRKWFDDHAFQPVTSAQFLAAVRRDLVRGDAALEQKLQLDRWVYQPGLPTNAVPANAQAFAEVDAAVRAHAAGTLPTAAWARWTTDERLRFLNRLPREQSRARLDALDRAFGLDRVGNMEVKYAWLSLAVANRYDPAIPSLEAFLATQGRRKFVRPLYLALNKDASWGRPIARRAYPVARPIYHPLVTGELDKLFGR